ncbi:MAG: energy transducer TonB [Candidatus Latescibacterota bacterium]|nr:MAG: energy transducer TonB [Candidatus Latescibacterota bacterium]
MAAAAAGRPGSGRYPRWGYLDKFEINEHMAPALLATILLHALALALFLACQWLGARPRERVPGPVPIRPVVLIDADVVPLPPALMVRVEPKPPAPSSSSGALRMVEDDDVFAVDYVGPSGPGVDTRPLWDPDFDGVLVVEVKQASSPADEPFVAVEVYPQLVQMDAPRYPELAREAGVAGEVLVRVLVGRDGLVRDAVVIRSVPMLDAAALAAARTAVFKPALQSGTPVAVWIVIPIRFELHD